MQEIFIEMIQGFMLEKVREPWFGKRVDSYRLEDPRHWVRYLHLE